MSLSFGLELELLLGTRKKSSAHSSWKSLAKDLSKRLFKAGIPNHFNDTNDTSQANYHEWSIVQEVTIPSQPGKNLWGIELVSPIYTPSTFWATDLATIFSVLHSSYLVLPSPHCSTHIHISSCSSSPYGQGSPGLFTPDQITSLAKSALFFESALDQLVPPERRNNPYWCQSNRGNPFLAGRPLSQCLALVEDNAMGTMREVVEKMNLFPADSAYGKAHGRKEDFVRGKVYKWDFTGMLPPGEGGSGRGTIEFRQAPGSLTSENAEGWITLALAFVAGAVSMNVNHLGVDADDQGATMDDLWDLFAGGAEVLGWQSLGEVERLFAKVG
ncbi:putative amidoligase enzyme-domain-containing protein [Podospora australis]|uniref:Amidoligase enzyme-domain-containing protein n=1 Tax=Podospora australis TaxID=1536484 RepID=A0AAN6WRR9_9PEZI|nr:putative amidoligase enzyme-domain-containing protein [Podospora australis]